MLKTSPPSADEFRMIDVGDKPDTDRRAVASGRFVAPPSLIRMVAERRLPKGDALALAEVAGIQAAKRTAELLPLCHPLALHSVRVHHEVRESEILVRCEVRTTGKTGVEMEALTGVTVALLCLHDLTKMFDPSVRFQDVLVESKEGGKSGHWVNPSAASPVATPPRDLEGVRACVLTVSDRCSRGSTPDSSGPLLREWLQARGAQVAGAFVVPDEVRDIQRQVEAWLECERPELILTTGGTGVSPRDVTPEAFAALRERLHGRTVPGVGELLRAAGARHTPRAWLSRSEGILVKGCLLVCLPGSERAVREGLGALGDLPAHLIHIARGGDHRRERLPDASTPG